METIKFTLTKTEDYELKPFGRFKIKWKVSKEANRKLDILGVNDISFTYDSGMPIKGDEDKAVVKFMIKNKTDVLTNQYRNSFYTRIGIGFTEISHPKLNQYWSYLTTNHLEDCPEVWKEYMGEFLK